MPSPLSTGPRRVLWLLVVPAVLAAALAGCGGSSSSTIASASSPTGSPQQRFFQARLSFARCLRQHGVDVPDPTPGQRPGQGEGGTFRQLRNDPKARTAFQACRKTLTSAFGSITPQQRAQFRAQAVRFAQCLRAHGLDVPDPSQSPGGGGFGFRRSFGSIDRNSPQFQQALQACRSERPQVGPGRGGPPPPTSSQ